MIIGPELFKNVVPDCCIKKFQCAAADQMALSTNLYSFRKSPTASKKC